jgi:antitoxin component YwqK of YwqJK toxin-antitoxin module
MGLLFFKYFPMRRIVVLAIVAGLQLVGFRGYSQWKSYIISPKGDTLNCVDNKDHRQGRWVNHFDEVRGEPGYEEEGVYLDSRKEGAWRLYTLQGDLIGLEYYKWGMKDGVCQYFGMNGSLLREESWRAMNPDKQYDTVQVAEVDKLDSYKTVVVKNEGIAVKDGTWKFYDPNTGTVARTEVYTLGKLAKPGASSTTAAAAAPQTATKPKEVLDFEKKTGKKKVKVQDGSTY